MKPRRTQRVIGSGLLVLILAVPALVIATPTNAQVYQCHGLEYCDAGVFCNMSGDQGTDNGKAEYWVNSGTSTLTHTTFFTDRWFFTNCSIASLTLKTKESTAEAKVGSCEEELCRARAWYDVTIGDDRGLAGAYCQKQTGETCHWIEDSTQSATKNQINVLIPNTTVISENCGFTEVASLINDEWRVHSSHHKCGETANHIGPLPL